MNLTDMFSFEESPWEQTLADAQPGTVLSALTVLMQTEDQAEEELVADLQELEERDISWDLSDLPRPLLHGAEGERLQWEQQVAKGADMAAALDENDPLAIYLQEISAQNIRLSLPEDAAALAKANREGKNHSIREKMLSGFLPRVVALAREYVGKGVLLMDLIQEGSMGLWNGILRYEGGDFGEQAERWIRFHMGKQVLLTAREKDVGEHTRQKMEDYRSVEEQLLGELGRIPTAAEIGERMHESPEYAERIGKMLESARNLRRAKTPREEEPEEDQAVEDTAYFQSRQRIQALLEQLEPMDAQILTLRFGLEDGKPRSAEQVGAKLNLSPEEVSRREAAALAKLRADS